MNTNVIQQAMENKNLEEMLSLYDYLGRPAGPSLGMTVWNAAKEANIPVTERQVSTRFYTGKILMYPKSFLQEYFNKSKVQRNEY